MNRFRTQQGAALVITLIMLGMVTAMTVVFLGISSRERASVTVVSDQISAKLMAETAAASALAKVVGRMVATQDPLAYDFSVSTNYHNRFGFVPGQVSPTNVSYVYPNGRSLTPDDLLINSGQPARACAAAGVSWTPTRLAGGPGTTTWQLRTSGSIST